MTILSKRRNKLKERHFCPTKALSAEMPLSVIFCFYRNINFTPFSTPIYIDTPTNWPTHTHTPT